MGLHAAVTGRFHASIPQLLLLAFVAGNGGAWADTAYLVSNVKNFPSSRGAVVGVLKAAVGLSGACVFAGGLGMVLWRAGAGQRQGKPAVLHALERRLRRRRTPPPPSACVCCAGSLFAAVYSGLFFPDKAAFLLFLALAPAAVGLLALPLINRWCALGGCL